MQPGRAMLRREENAARHGSSAPALFTSLKDGMQQMVNALVDVSIRRAAHEVSGWVPNG